MALGGHELMLDIGREQSGGGDDPWLRRHEHAWDLELERDVACEQRPGTASGHEGEVTRVIAPPHRIELDRLRHPEPLQL